MTQHINLWRLESKEKEDHRRCNMESIARAFGSGQDCRIVRRCGIFGLSKEVDSNCPYVQHQGKESCTKLIKTLIIRIILWPHHRREM